MFGREAGFVGLKVSDQLPLDGCGGLRTFGDGFLDAIFSDGAKAGARDVIGGIGRVRLGHGKELDLGRIAAGGAACGRDLITHLDEPVAKFVIRREH